MADSIIPPPAAARKRLVCAVLKGTQDELAQACRQVNARAALAELLTVVTGQQGKTADRAFKRLVRVGQQVGVFS